MGLVERIRERAAGRAEVMVTEGPGWIEVRSKSESGFPVRVYERDGQDSIHFSGWHEDASDEAETLNMVALGLSKSARLKVASRGGRDYSWTLESWEEGQWRPVSETALIFFPFWRRRSVRYLQNPVVE
jgi:hypothetical protein